MTKRLTMVLVISVALAISSPAVVGCQSEESTTTEDATTTQEGGTTSQDATTTASSSTVGPETLTTLTAWGENFFGQLGNGVTLPYGSHSNTPVEVSDLEGAEVKAISGGQLHSLAPKDDDTVWAWGDNTSSQGTRIGGQLGDSEITSSNTPVQVRELPGGVEAIAAGASHGLALKDDGTVWAWGSNERGQLGNGTETLGTNTFRYQHAGTGEQPQRGQGHSRRIRPQPGRLVVLTRLAS